MERQIPNEPDTTDYELTWILQKGEAKGAVGDIDFASRN